MEQPTPLKKRRCRFLVKYILRYGRNAEKASLAAV
jgi:hypothetical protein